MTTDQTPAPPRSTPHSTPLAAPPPLGSLSRVALLLDFDGTLVNIASAPHLIAVPADLPEILAALSDRLVGRLAIVSGRSVADLDSHIDLSAIAAAGSHGGEIRDAGAKDARPLARIAKAATDAARTLAGRHQALRLETKTYGMAVHFRGIPEMGAEVDAAMQAIAARYDLGVKRGKLVVELLPKGFNKGAAVNTLMKMQRFVGSRPIFIGDDVTDEDGFVAADALGGFGILVGAPRATAARYRLAGTEEVHAWLTA